MKIRIPFKNPDAIDHALAGLDPEERNEVNELLHNWVDYGEYITIEIDTVLQTAMVVRAQK